MATTTEQPIPGAEEKKIEASELVAAEAPASASPAIQSTDEKQVEAESTPEAPPKTEPTPVPVPVAAAVAVEDKKDVSEDTSTPAPETAAPIVEEKKPAPVATPLEKLFAELPAIIKEADHGEMWEVKLSDASHIPTSIVLEKFLRANTKDVTKAKSQLIEALKWRKKMQPQKLLAEMEFDKSKFGDLGFVTVYPKTEAHGKEIVTWNIYGAVKDNKATFGNVEEYVFYLQIWFMIY
jgi:hypothetical protein